MLAAFITETGDASKIQYGELPKPTPAQGEVLVKVEAVAVNPIDTYIRSGMVAMPLKMPYVIGCDLAGTVESVGLRVRRLKVGDRVWGTNQGLFGRQVTFAEYASVDEKWLYPIPPAETAAEAAAGALVGITAYMGLFRFARMQTGEIVFVNGGSGGIGSSVIQQAKAAGAQVITTVGNADKATYCRHLGADVALDYNSPTLDDEIRHYSASRGGINIWFETLREPTLERTISMMAPRGRILLIAGRQARPEFTLGPFYTKDLAMLGYAMFNASPDEQRECATAINDLYVRSGWHPAVGITLPLSQAAFAHQLQEDNTLHKKGTLSGKIVLVPGS